MGKRKQKSTFCCGKNECCNLEISDIATKRARRDPHLPPGWPPLTESYIRTVSKIRHLVRKATMGSFFLLYWAGSNTIAYECSDTLCLLTQNTEFKVGVKAAFASCYNQYDTSRNLSPDELVFALSHVDFTPVNVHEKIRVTNQTAKRQEGQLAEACRALSETKFPFLTVYTSYDFTRLVKLGDEESKKLAASNSGMWQQIAPLFHHPRSMKLLSTKRSESPRLLNPRIGTHPTAVSMEQHANMERVYEEGDLHSVLLLLNRPEVFPVTAIAEKDDATKLLAFPDVTKDESSGEFRVSPHRPRIVRLHPDGNVSCSCQTYTFSALQSCPHVFVVRKQMDKFLNLEYPQPGTVHRLECIRGNQRRCLYAVDDGFVVLDDSKNNLMCRVCTSSRRCKHVELVANYLASVDSGESVDTSEQNDGWRIDDMTDIIDELGYSEMGRVKVSYPVERLPAKIKESLRIREVEGFRTFHEEAGVTFMRPCLSSLGTCNCSEPYNENGLETIGNVPVFMDTAGGRMVAIQRCQCPNQNAECMQFVNALELGLWMMGTNEKPRMYFSLGSMYTALELVLKGVAPGTVAQTMQHRYSVLGYSSTTPFPCENTFREAIFLFMGDLDVASRNPFICPCCGPSPEILIGDATLLTIESGRYSGKGITSTAPSPPIRRHHNRAQRAFVDDRLNVQGRKIVRSWLKDLSRWVAEYDLLDPFEAPEFVPEASTLSLEEFYKWVKDVMHRLPIARLGTCKEYLSEFIWCLSTESPVISYLPISVSAEVRRVLTNEHNVCHISRGAMDLISRESPILHNLLSVVEATVTCSAEPEVTITRECLHTSLGHILMELCQRAALCVTGSSVDVLSVEYRESSFEFPGCYKQSGICCGLPKVRDRGQYEADFQSEQEPQDRYTGPPSRTNRGCLHRFKGGNWRTGGIFTWFCQHGVCYAFYIIPKAEGRDEAFSFVTCYLEKAPKVIIYDFACSLHEYCLNRLPGFFRHTLFVVDALHFCQHVKCALSYDSKRYPRLKHVNTQIAEQNNSALRRIKPTATRAKQSTFMILVLIFLSVWNIRKIKSAELHRSIANHVVEAFNSNS